MTGLKRMALVFDDKAFEKLKDRKEVYRSKKGFTKLSWEDYIFAAIVNFK